MVTCISSLVKVAIHPLLHSSKMLTSDVWREASGNMCAVSGAGRWGNHNSPTDEELIVSPLGSATRMLLSCRTLLSVTASVSRSSICEDPVSAHGRWVTRLADEEKTFGLEQGCVKLPSKILTSWPTYQRPCVDRFATSVWVVAAFMAAVYSGRAAICRHLELLWELYPCLKQ